MSPTAALRSTATPSQQETTTATFFSDVDTVPSPASVSTGAAPASIGSPVSAPTALGAETRAEPLTVDVASLSIVTPTPFTLLQQWEGIVAEQPTADDFVATLRDLTAPSRPEERATFPLDQVPLADRGLVVAGAVFYWAIAYEDLPTGTRRTVSELRFRRLPAWSKNDMRRVKKGVERLKDILRDFE